MRYSGSSLLAVSGNVCLSRFQLSGLTLYVELVICLTPSVASALISFSGLSLRDGITGSILAHTGMLFCVSCWMALIRFVGGGALGSSFFASSSSSVVMVNATTAFIVRSMSMSLVTRSDLVMIWILHGYCDSVLRLWRVRFRLFSMVG